MNNFRLTQPIITNHKKINSLLITVIKNWPTEFF